MNRVTLLGNCARDTELITTQGKPMARLRIATISTWRDANGEGQEWTEFTSVTVFGRLAEVAHTYALKGRQVFVVGRLRTSDYTDSDGNRHFVTVVVGDTVRLLGSPARRDDADAAQAGCAWLWERNGSGDPPPAAVRRGQTP